MSSALVERPSEHRTAPMAQSTATPIATRTCDGSTLPEVHAEPAETPMPFRSRPSTIDSDSTWRKSRLAVPGSRLTGWPDSFTSGDRKSTRLNSSHSQISYAVFCLKKKKKKIKFILFYTKNNTKQ